MKISPGRAFPFLLALLSAMSCASGEGVEAKPAKLPRAITQHHEAGKWSYSVSGIITREPEPDLKEANESHAIFVPECSSFQLERAARRCRFITTRELSSEELVKTIDELARIGGEVPYWAELEARDLPKSSKGGNVYQIVRQSGEFPEEAEWIPIPKAKRYEAEISLPEGAKGRLLIVPSTAFCMCHSRYCIRILDHEGKVTWQEDREAYGGMHIAIADLDKDGVQEVMIERDDHGKEGRFLIQLKRGKR